MRVFYENIFMICCSNLAAHAHLKCFIVLFPPLFFLLLFCLSSLYFKRNRFCLSIEFEIIFSFFLPLSTNNQCFVWKFVKSFIVQSKQKFRIIRDYLWKKGKQHHGKTAFSIKKFAIEYRFSSSTKSLNLQFINTTAERYSLAYWIIQLVGLIITHKKVYTSTLSITFTQ